MKRFKKKAMVGLVSLLTISNVAFGVGLAKADTATTDQLIQLPKTDQLSIQPSNYFGPHDKVRVVVELDGAPAISYATNIGVRYKDLSDAKKQELQTDVKQDQSQFMSEIQGQHIDFNVQNTFTTVVNGVSGDIEYGKIDELKKLPDVQKVSIVNQYERPIEKPELISSKQMVEAIQTWNAGFTGKGMVIGIIDTGIDPSHKDMVLAPDPAQKLTEAKVNDLKASQGLLGKYYTVKVPYGYNYADKNNTILDLGPNATMHGMHVAGITGANGDESNNGVKGVAPDAQLLALKVFGNDPAMPSTFGDIYVKAIDDGIKLGADVMNMSLGSTAGFVSPDGFEQSSIERAVNNGVLMSISAGNSDQIGDGGPNPSASNPDIGLVGSPGVTPGSISVASIENDKITLDKMVMTIGGEALPVAFKRQSTPDPLQVLGTNKDIDVVYVGDGSTAQFAGKDVKGKVVFAVRANATPLYADIQKNAEAAGAAGVIIRGREVHGDYVSMALNNPLIPMVSLGISDGNMLQAKLIANGGVGKVNFTGSTMLVANTSAGKLSTFTSWGVTPDLELKPELTAPGGQIYSTFNDNQYGVMSGTSMAAPHVSGGSALVLQRVQQLWPTLQGADKVKRAKVLLMNTAKPVHDPDNNNIYYSPRRQGAGLMQLFQAVTTPVYVVRKGTNDAKVELKEINSDVFDMTITATNFSNKDVTYDVNTSVLTDGVANGLNTLHAQEITKAVVTTDTPRVTLFAGQSRDITVRVDLSKAKADLEAQMKNGYFVEGFITLSGVSNDVTQPASPELSVPFVGFKGDWNAAPVLDQTIYDASSYFNTAGMIDQSGYYMGYNPFTKTYDKNHLAISPNGDGKTDAVAPVLDFLRNSKMVEYSITDANGNMVRKLRTDTDQTKNYIAQKVPYSYQPTYTQWDGLIDNKTAADGQYFYQIKTQVDYAGKDPQVVRIPVVVDNTVPTVANAAYSKKNSILSFDAADNGSGLRQIDIKVDGKLLGSLNPAGKQSFSINLGNTVVNNSIDIVATDYANNSSTVSVSAPGDNTIPYIVTSSPVALGYYDTKEVPVTGYVTDGSKVAYLTLTGDGIVGSPVNVNLTYNPTTKHYEFATQVTFSADGAQDIYFEGADVVGNKIQFRRTVFIDTEGPTLQVSGLPANNVVAANGQNPEVTVSFADNFDDLRLVVNGNEEYRHDFDQPFVRRPLAVDHKMTLNLKDGRNDYVFEVTDLTGHKVRKTVSVYKGDNPPAGFITSLSVTPDGNISAGTPATITAEASQSITWDVKVIDPDGNAIALPSAQGTTYEGTFTPDSLAASGQYTVVVEPAGGSAADAETATINVTNDPISVAAVSTTNADGEKTSSFTKSDSVSIKASLKNVGRTVVNPTVLIQVKNAAGAVVYLGKVNVNSINQYSQNYLGADIPLDGFESGSYSVEVFVWDNLNNPIPLADASKAGFFNVN